MVVRTKVRKTQIFFKVQTEKNILELVKVQYEYCKKYKTTIACEITDLEHVKRIRFLSRVHAKISSASQYKTQIEELIDIPLGVIEIKKEIVY